MESTTLFCAPNYAFLPTRTGCSPLAVIYNILTNIYCSVIDALIKINLYLQYNILLFNLELTYLTYDKILMASSSVMRNFRRDFSILLNLIEICTHDLDKQWPFRTVTDNTDLSLIMCAE